MPTGADKGRRLLKNFSLAKIFNKLMAVNTKSDIG
jgi:hypothetical protein